MAVTDGLTGKKSTQHARPPLCRNGLQPKRLQNLLTIAGTTFFPSAPE
jgi:hypothetical protein